MIALFTTMKSLPLAYNKDMQEDKEGVFDAVDTVLACLGIFKGMIEGMTALEDNMYRAASGGFINATDLADYLVKRGLPFRSAYKISGGIVELQIPLKAKLDGEYVEKMSFAFDCKCFFGTIASVLRHDGVVEGGTGQMNKEREEE
jgi:argininosuccinate lyase